MGRKLTIRQSEFPYHIVTRSNQQRWFVQNLNDVWRFSIESLAYAYKKYPVSICSFVLMSNHYHLMLKTPDANIDLFMYEFNKILSLKIREGSNTINRMFGSRYKWSIITNDDYYFNVVRYIFQNPLRAGICQKCEDYPFSTLHYQYYQKLLELPFSVDFPLGWNQAVIHWFNHAYSEDEAIIFRKGLRKKFFTYQEK